MDNNKHSKYYSMVGSYSGLIRVTYSTWIRVEGLNMIDKHDWICWQGPATPGMEKALKSKLVFQAVDMFPDRKIDFSVEK